MSMEGVGAWESLKLEAMESGPSQTIYTLEALLNQNELDFLMEQLSSLDRPEEIQKLLSYGTWQERQGAGFCGMLSNPLAPEDVVIPADVRSTLSFLLRLTEARKRNLDAIRKATPYVLEFSGSVFPEITTSIPKGWSLQFDVTPVERLLALYDKENVSLEDALEIALLPGNQAMLEHRRRLGYIPEPLVTTESLARLILKSASTSPLDQLWKWVSPHNLFDLADVYMHRKKYRQVVEELKKHREDMAAIVLSAIYRYAPSGVVFRDKITFAFEWGIRGWATDETGGISLEFFKDNYRLLLGTMAHETFHRFQVRVCPVDPDLGRSFSGLLSYPFPSAQDRLMYSILGTIMAEGTATIVGKLVSGERPFYELAKAEEGMELLNRLYNAIYRENDRELAETLHVAGVKSNGPFYDLGAFMTAAIEKCGGGELLGRCLRAGAPEFFLVYKSCRGSTEFHWTQGLEAVLNDMKETIARGQRTREN